LLYRLLEPSMLSCNEAQRRTMNARESQNAEYSKLRRCNGRRPTFPLYRLTQPSAESCNWVYHSCSGGSVPDMYALLVSAGSVGACIGVYMVKRMQESIQKVNTKYKARQWYDESPEMTTAPTLVMPLLTVAP